MEGLPKEHLNSIIKVEAEEVSIKKENEQSVREFEQVWISGQDSSLPIIIKEGPILDQESPATSFAEVYQPSPALVKPPPIKRQKITKCTMRSCNWCTKSQDKDVIFLLLKYHMSSCHNDVSEICDVCFTMFKVKKHLEDHVREVHGSFQCRFCLFQLSSQEGLQDHFKKQHNIYNVEQYNNVIKSLSIPSIVNNTPPVLQNSNSVVKTSNSLSKTSNSMSIKSPDCNESTNSNVKEHNSSIEKPISNDQGPISTASVNHDVANIPTTKPSYPNNTCHLCHCNFLNPVKLWHHRVQFHLVPSDVNMDSVTFTGPAIRKLACKECPALFLQPDTLKNHYITFHKRNVPQVRKSMKYTCSECRYSHPPRCRYSLFDLSSLKNHYLEVHSKELNMDELEPSYWYTVLLTELLLEENKLIFTCKYCSDVYTTSCDLNKHVSKEHKECVCRLCRLKCHTILKERLHYEEVHLGYCKYCRYKTKNCTKMFAHFRQKHPHIPHDVDAPILYKRKKTRLVHVYHRCELCQRKLSSAQNTKMHYHWFHNQYFCTFCNITFETVNEEYSHYKYCHPTIQHFMCERCGDSFNTYKKLSKHREKEAKRLRKLEIERIRCQQNSKKICEICEQCVQNLRSHVYCIHGLSLKNLENLELRCNICDEKFDCIDTLREHLELHPKFNCEQCPMQFNFVDHLEDHVMEIHTDRCSFSCSVCRKLFATLDDFSFHHKFVDCNSKPWPLSVLHCDLCGFVCESRNWMEGHMESEHIDSRDGSLVNFTPKNK